MTAAALAKLVDHAKCKVYGAEDAGSDGHRLALANLIAAFNTSESILLCEPSLARKTSSPPDIVLIDPEIGVHVFEIKAFAIDQIEAIEPGGKLRVRYSGNTNTKNPITQVRNAMFDIKDATSRAFGGDLRLRFDYWVVFTSISRSQWITRFGKQAFCADQFLFAEDIDTARLVRRLGASDRQNSTQPIELCPLAQLQCVWHAFGDTSVLYTEPESRPPRKAGEGTLGEQFDEAADAFKELSKEQQDLSITHWESGPRVVRGVAGSGKTVVLANNLARRLERMLAADQNLFQRRGQPRILAVCFNRTLAPFIEQKIQAAFQQRTGNPVPKGMVEVRAFNKLMYQLSTAGIWRYQNIDDVEENVRAKKYLSELQLVKQREPDRLRSLAYDAIYVDEGQDVLEEEFKLLKELCCIAEGSEPNLYVFYDDAQSLYGRNRPNWQSLGLNVRGGRSFVMSQCFRNTRPIVESTFNVLYGTCATSAGGVPTREYGDIKTLEEKGLIENDSGFWRVRFAMREGMKPRLSLASNARHEIELLVAKLRWLLGEQEVRPEDILVLTVYRRRVDQLANALHAANLPGVAGIHVATYSEAKDRSLRQPGSLTVSTVASAKGYDAYCVLLASANEFPTDVIGRASFYVGCTRAIEYLEVFAYAKTGLASEMDAVLSRVC